jgi:hypothetical protein
VVVVVCNGLKKCVNLSREKAAGFDHSPLRAKIAEQEKILEFLLEIFLLSLTARHITQIFDSLKSFLLSCRFRYVVKIILYIYFKTIVPRAPSLCGFHDQMMTYR